VIYKKAQMYVQVCLKKYFISPYVNKISLKTPPHNCFENHKFKNKWSEKSSRSAYSANLDDSLGVSVWLLFSANSAIFQLYHGENKLIINEMMMRSANELGRWI
jgi:hypothetical protein